MMGDLIAKLGEVTAREDKARSDLFEAQGEMRHLVRENVTQLLDMGLLDVKVRKDRMRALMDPPRTESKRAFA